jgi:hypothetical protein
MDEQRAGEGGPASTPPFPRSQEDAELAQSPAGEDAFVPRGGTDSPVEAPPPHAYGGGAAELDDESSGDAAGRRTAHEARAGRRTERGGNRGFERFAERLEDAAARLGRLADDQLRTVGPAGMAADAAGSTAGWLDSTADYLRASDLRSMQGDLERQVRERPLQTLAIALCVGWALGKIMR